MLSELKFDIEELDVILYGLNEMIKEGIKVNRIFARPENKIDLTPIYDIQAKIEALIKVSTNELKNNTRREQIIRCKKEKLID